MSQRKQSPGCRQRRRRTFLFLTGIAIARVLADYFSVPQNRYPFFAFAGKMWQKLLAFSS